MYKYRSSIISRATKKKKSPGRKRKAPTTNVNASEDEAIITTEAEVPQTTSTNINESTCSKQLKNTHRHQPDPEKSSLWYYLLFDIRVLNDIIDVIGSRPECSSKMSVVHDLPSKKGLAHCINISCIECDWTSTFCTSKKIMIK